MSKLSERIKGPLGTILGNVASVGVVQLANYIIPILIIPFVTRALGVFSFGTVSFAQNIIGYLTILVTFGFEYSATQDVAIHRESQRDLRIIFWSVIQTRVYLFLLSLLVLSLLGFFMKRIADDPWLYANAALINLGVALFPTWFFQGIEKMAKMAAFNFAIKAFGALLIILFVSKPSDYQIYIFILSVSYVLVGLIAMIYVVAHYKLTYLHVKGEPLAKAVFKKSTPIFLNNFFVSMYTLVGITILGLYKDDATVGVYSGANRIIMAIMMLTSMPINVALFPAMSRTFNESKEKGWRYFRKMLLIVGVGGIFVSLLTWLFAPLAVKILLGPQFEASLPLLRLFSVLPFLVIMSSMLTVQGLYGLQLQRLAPYMGAAIAVISISLNFALIPQWGIWGAGFAWVISQVCEILIAATILKVKKR